MGFDLDKQNALTKLDKSKKGEVDKPIQKILTILNGKKNYYTTSSCSGRIIIMKIPQKGRKCDVQWLFCSHQPAKVQEIVLSLKKSLKEIKQNVKHDIWFKQESAILHIACRDLHAAELLLHIVRDCGLKRSGIISTKGKIILEIINTNNMATIIAKQGKIIVDKKYLNILVKEANAKLDSNFKKLERLENALKKL